MKNTKGSYIYKTFKSKIPKRPITFVGIYKTCGKVFSVFFIILIIFCFVYFMYQYIPNNRRSYIFKDNKSLLRQRLLKRIQSRHCFNTIIDPNVTSINSTSELNVSISRTINMKTSINSSDSEKNVHNATQRTIVFAAENKSNMTMNKTSTSKTTKNGLESTDSLTAGQISDTITPQITYDIETNIADGPEIACHVRCPRIPSDLNGPFEVDYTEISLADLETTQLDVVPGGHFAPRHCKPRYRVAVIVPHRNREVLLAIFINNIHRFLMRQEIEYKIYVVEQKGLEIFNKASLMNVAFIEALRQQEWDCFVFNDVDLLPLDDRILYTCPNQPRHLSVSIDTLDFKLPYTTLFGGVTALTTEQFINVNGFSNRFWGWGGEDDDMANRIMYHDYRISRYPTIIARYTMLNHTKEVPNPSRFEILSDGKQLFEIEGLSNIEYKLVETRIHRLYTVFLAEFEDPSST